LKKYPFKSLCLPIFQFYPLQATLNFKRIILPVKIFEIISRQPEYHYLIQLLNPKCSHILLILIDALSVQHLFLLS